MPDSALGLEGLDTVGLVPAAGTASRLGRLPCSKEIVPVSLGGADGRPTVKTACEHLLENMARAGIARAYLVLRTGKWDVPAYFEDGGAVGINLAYLALGQSSSVLETLDRAYPFVRGQVVALGFPDILFEPADAFAHLLRRRRASGADAVLALVPTDRPEKADVVESDDAGRVTGLAIKPEKPAGRMTWVAAVWSPAFTEHLRRFQAKNLAQDGRELYPGDALQAAVEDGMAVEAVTFEEGSHLDIGTPEDLRRAVAGGFSE